MSRESSCTTYFRTTPNMVKKDQLTCLCSDPKSVNDPVKDAEYLMAILKIHKVWIGSFRNPESSAFGCPSFQQAAETYGNKWTPFSNYEYNQGLSRGADAVCAASHPSSTTDLKTFTMWWKVWNGKNIPILFLGYEDEQYFCVLMRTSLTSTQWSLWGIGDGSGHSVPTLCIEKFNDSHRPQSFSRSLLDRDNKSQYSLESNPINLMSSTESSPRSPGTESASSHSDREAAMGEDTNSVVIETYHDDARDKDYNPNTRLRSTPKTRGGPARGGRGSKIQKRGARTAAKQPRESMSGIMGSHLDSEMQKRNRFSDSNPSGSSNNYIASDQTFAEGEEQTPTVQRMNTSMQSIVSPQESATIQGYGIEADCMNIDNPRAVSPSDNSHLNHGTPQRSPEVSPRLNDAVGGNLPDESIVPGQGMIVQTNDSRDSADVAVDCELTRELKRELARARLLKSEKKAEAERKRSIYAIKKQIHDEYAEYKEHDKEVKAIEDKEAQLNISL